MRGWRSGNIVGLSMKGLKGLMVVIWLLVKVLKESNKSVIYQTYLGIHKSKINGII